MRIEWMNQKTFRKEENSKDESENIYKGGAQIGRIRKHLERRRKDRRNQITFRKEENRQDESENIYKGGEQIGGIR